jgi:hypothetical protein
LLYSNLQNPIVSISTLCIPHLTPTPRLSEQEHVHARALMSALFRALPLVPSIRAHTTSTSAVPLSHNTTSLHTTHVPQQYNMQACVCEDPAPFICANIPFRT